MYQLTEEGKKYLKDGLPEKNLLKILPKSMADISKMPNVAIAVGWAKKNNWIEIKEGMVVITSDGEKVLNKKSNIEIVLEEVNKKGESGSSKILLNRNLIEEVKESKQKIVKTKKGFIKRIFGKDKEVEKTEEVKEIAQLTPEMIKTGMWKNIPMKNYDISTPAPKIYPGKKQHYVQFIEDMQQKLIALGFKEMEGPLVEVNFWNSDVLFMPQDHPARSLHDAFFLKHPTQGTLPDENLIAKVKATHEGGWVTGSSGWGSEWNEDEAKKLMMRSHTTSVSMRTLMEHGDRPGKYFTIDRNYRYDVIDAGHLVEFDQCEGIVIGQGLTLKHLLGYLKEFGKMVGIEKIKFKPSYFPYTEPSVELYAKMPKLGWIELGGAGLFRPEVLRPLGIEKCQVLAWGLGLGRLAMLKIGIDDIRGLYSSDLKYARNLKMVR